MIQKLLENAQAATRSVKGLPDGEKQRLLQRLAAHILENTAAIQAENIKDAEKMSLTDPKLDRLVLNQPRIKTLAESLKEIALLPDPANQVLVDRILENGLHVQKLTVPLGVVGVIYESRPNVTLDVAALCIR